MINLEATLLGLAPGLMSGVYPCIKPLFSLAMVLSLYCSPGNFGGVPTVSFEISRYLITPDNLTTNNARCVAAAGPVVHNVHMHHPGV